MKKTPIILTLVVLLILLCCAGYLSYKALETNNNQVMEGPTITVNGKQFYAEIADTPETQAQGLSDRTRLAKDTVMLFVFTQGGPQGIWMKDMRFPLDIIWLNKKMEVIKLLSAVSPDSYPAVFQADIKTPAWYVIEANAGFIKENKVATGTVFTLIR